MARQTRNEGQSLFENKPAWFQTLAAYVLGAIIIIGGLLLAYVLNGHGKW